MVLIPSFDRRNSNFGPTLGIIETLLFRSGIYLNKKPRYGRNELSRKKMLIITTKNLFLNSLFLNFLKKFILNNP